MTENEKKLKEIEDLLLLREYLKRKVAEEKEEKERLEFIKKKDEYMKELKKQQELHLEQLEEEKKQKELDEKLYLEQEKEREKIHAKYIRENGLDHWAVKDAIAKYIRDYRDIKYNMHYTPDLDDKFILKAQKELIEAFKNINDNVTKYLTKDQIKQINKTVGFKAIKERWF